MMTLTVWKAKCLKLQLDNYHKNICGANPVIASVYKDGKLLDGTKMP